MVSDTWDLGELYEPYVGRWSRLAAVEFLDWLAVEDGAVWLDVGCGTGALSRSILDRREPGKVYGIDPSSGYTAFAREHLIGRPFDACVGSASALPYADRRFDAVVSGLVVNFTPDPAVAVAEMRRVARPGAVIAAYVWDYAGRMQLMRMFWDVAVDIDESARSLDEGVRFPLCNPASLSGLFSDAGLQGVATTQIDVPTVFRDFDDYWQPFLGGQAPAPGYCMSLDEGRRANLREAIRRRLPVEEDGSISLVARAWAVRGRAP